MKNLYIVLVGCLLLTACGKSEEEKLKDLVAEATKSSLYIPESYDPVSTECDSLMTSVITAKNIKNAAKFVELMTEAKGLQRDIEYNTEQTEYWKGKYGDFYRDYSKKAQRGIDKQQKKLDEARAIVADIYQQYTAEPEFIGFIVDHKYRAKNNAGQVCFGEVIYILNKEKDAIVAAYSVDDEDMLYFLQLSSALKELGSECEFEEVDLYEISDNIKSKYELL